MTPLRILIGAVTSTLLLTGSPAAAQDRTMTVEAARAHMATMARPGGFWAASNAGYATAESGEPEEYRMRFIRSEDGYTMRGCMWAAVEGRPQVFWRFFAGWDPGDHAIFQYQVHPAGIVGYGRMRPGPDGHAESIETLFTPDQAPEFSRHLNRVVHADTLESRSFGGTPDAWTPRRSYTWIWRPSAETTPCP